MLDSSRREVLVSTLISSVRDLLSGAAVAYVARLTGIEALEPDDDEGDEPET